MSQLLPCPRCKRHVRSAETECPFCEATLPARGPASAGPFRGRMSRAAIMAAGATLMVAGAACESDPPKSADAGGDTSTMSDSAGGDRTGTPELGGGDDALGADAGNTTDSAANDRGIVALYGVAPAPEYGVPPPSQKAPADG